MSRELTPPPALAGLDLAAHRERAKRALVLHLGGQDLSRSPAEWEAQAEALLVLLERYGIVPLWVFDPKIAPRPFEHTASSATYKLIEAVLAGRPALRLPPLAPVDIDRLRGLLPSAGDQRMLTRVSNYFWPDDVGGGA